VAARLDRVVPYCKEVCMSLLSSKSVDELVACTMARPGVGVAARRAAAREAVTGAAEELGIDPLAPPLPRFSTGEDEVAAAVLRVLKVPGVDKELEKHRARAAACRAAAERLAELEDRARQLQRIELGRLHDQIMAGKVPGPAPADAIAERSKIAAELELVGAADVAAWVPETEAPLLMDAAMRPDVFPSVIFYFTLLAERLRMLNEGEHYKSAASMTAQRTAGTVEVLVRKINGGHDRDLDRMVRAVRNAVTLADLHLLQEHHELTVEELETARAGR
jgi:hypothetical protein